MIRVWFNHWFSTSYRLIELMKDNKDEQVYVIGTNKQVNSVIQQVCDEWYEEPVIEEENYVKYCLDFCVEHKIDVFVPRHFMVNISQNIDKFNQLGVKVMIDDYSIMELLNNKAKAYDFFKDCKGLNIPEYCIVNNAEKSQIEMKLNGEQLVYDSLGGTKIYVKINLLFDTTVGKGFIVKLEDALSLFTVSKIKAITAGRSNIVPITVPFPKSNKPTIC